MGFDKPAKRLQLQWRKTAAALGQKNGHHSGVQMPVGDFFIAVRVFTRAHVLRIETFDHFGIGRQRDRLSSRGAAGPRVVKIISCDFTSWPSMGSPVRPAALQRFIATASSMFAARRNAVFPCVLPRLGHGHQVGAEPLAIIIASDHNGSSFGWCGAPEVAQSSSGTSATFALKIQKCERAQKR